MTKSDFNELAACSRSPWRFLTRHVQTQEPVSGALPFPEYDYLKHLVDDALRNRYLLVPKSRQMMVTWTMIALFLWRALFQQPGLYLLLSRNERCAEELLERARFILNRLPEFMRPKLGTNNKSELEFAGLDSRLISLPATPDGPRMYSPTAVLWDEMAFTPFDTQIWTALKPALSSGGSFVGVSSSGGALNLFAKLIQQSQEQSHPERSEGPLRSSQRESSLRDASFRMTEKANDHPFHIHRIHYSQHPDRNAPWKKQESRGLSLNQWNREQEISFEHADDLVYAEFDPIVHILKEEFHPRREWDLYRSIDFGYRKPFVLWLQKLPSGEYVVFSEWEGRDATTEGMHAAITRTDLVFGLTEADYSWSSCDPAGAQAQDSGISPVDYLTRNGVKLRYRPSRILSGVELVKAALRDATGKISLFISPSCRKLILDLNRYRWNTTKDEPLKDGDSDHSLDALRYFFVNLDSFEEKTPASPRLAKWQSKSGHRWPLANEIYRVFQSIR
ncbi:MAG: hypothetical protein H6505_03270 [Calditrichaeota bacterium]|nr:hypothetical protein [Calditrichota bacterium]